MVIEMDIVLTSISEILNNLDMYLEVFLSDLGIFGTLISCLLITIESIIPVLPLCVFVTLVFYAFGNFFGFIISWIFTLLGCYLSFTLIRSKFRNWFVHKFIKDKEKGKMDNLMSYIDKMSISSLSMLVAIPFTPAFLVNIAAGLSNMSKKKYMISMMIGKIFMVYFWGYIGTTLIESLTHPKYLIKIVIMILCAFIISKIVNKYLKID